MIESDLPRRPMAAPFSSTFKSSPTPGFERGKQTARLGRQEPRSIILRIQRTESPSPMLLPDKKGSTNTSIYGSRVQPGTGKDKGQMAQTEETLAFDSHLINPSLIVVRSFVLFPEFDRMTVSSSQKSHQEKSFEGTMGVPMASGLCWPVARIYILALSFIASLQRSACPP
ncbi:MAG: hypothetical protein J3Q66DRAFT_372997 [Benniella sp.]|nr:MAG: hypothetical protein J3Q66DRAFT_372997 [Benniella sp.]